MIKNRFVVIAVLSSLVLGCATTYKGPPPNFKLTGDAAKAEIEKFRFPESYWTQAPSAFMMGPAGNLYWSSSLKPVIAETSPRAWDLVKTAKTWRYIGLVSYVGVLAILAAELVDHDHRVSSDQFLAYFSLAGISISSSFIARGYMHDAAKQYNRDLTSRFTPAVALSFPID